MKLGGEAIAKAVRTDRWKVYANDSKLDFEEVFKLIQPNSLDVRLSEHILIPSSYPKDAVDIYSDEQVGYTPNKIPVGGCALYTTEFILGCTIERIDCSKMLFIDDKWRHFAPMYEGRSTLGRLGIGTHVTAGFGDHGFQGAFTLEIFNLNPRPIKLYPGMRIGQIYFDEVYEPYKYSGSYNDKKHYSYPVEPRLGRERF